jgi:hypothetical protein
LLGYDRVLAARVASAFAGELDRSLKKRAKAALGLSTVTDAHTWSVLAVQRTDSALRLNVHFHLLGLDGVYVLDQHTGRLVFHALGTPTRAEVADVAARTGARIEKILRKAGRSLDPEMQDAEPPELCEKEPGLAACYAAAAQGVSVSGDRAGLPPLRLVVSVDPKSPTDDPADPIAEVRGVNVHARQVVDGRDRRPPTTATVRVAAPTTHRGSSSTGFTQTYWVAHIAAKCATAIDAMLGGTCQAP